MDFIENKSCEELIQTKECIEKHLLNNDYENAFAVFLLLVVRLNAVDRDDIITPLHI
jgi:hypothetical protein